MSTTAMSDEARVARLWVVGYDICDAKRLRRVAAACESHALRVQYSVFEGVLTHEARGTAAMAVAVEMDAVEDSVVWHPLCRRCQRAVVTLGVQGQATELSYWIV